MKKNTAYMLTMTAAMVAMNVVLGRITSIRTFNTTIGLGFIPVALAAMLFGPLWGGLVGALGDIIGALLFPVGAYFPGFTVTAFFFGFVYGLFLYKKQNAGRVVAAVLINNVFGTMLMNSYWITLISSSPFSVLAKTRLIQIAVLIPVQIAVNMVLIKILPRIKKAA